MKERQEEAMSKLVSWLNNDQVSIVFASLDQQGKYGGHSSPLLKYNIFEIGKLAEYGDTGFNSEKDSDREMTYRTMVEYDDARVVVDASYRAIIDVSRFIDDVYIPKSVSDELCSFAVKYADVLELPLPYYENDKLVIINPGGFYSRKTTYQGVCMLQSYSCISWLNLKNSAKSLTSAIEKWYLDNGIDNPNIRIDFKNGIEKPV